MRNIFIFALALLSIIGCKKDEDIKIDEPEFGSIEVNKNGQPWDAKVWATKFLGDTTKLNISIFKNIDECDICTEAFHFSNVSKGAGHYNIIKLAPYYPTDNVGGTFITNVSDGDLVGDIGYPTIDTVNNFLDVEFFDSINQELYATFSTIIVLKKPKYDESLPDTLKFENGKFKVKVSN
ncbi:MAG: hypothetical protein PSV35_08250 [bacterium]|nr:hypothetical protein [bacterium]